MRHKIDDVVYLNHKPFRIVCVDNHADSYLYGKSQGYLVVPTSGYRLVFAYSEFEYVNGMQGWSLGDCTGMIVDESSQGFHNDFYASNFQD